MMKYKNYAGMVEFDGDACIFRGRVLGIRDTITFQGKTVDEIRQAFQDSVDDYLEFCRSRGESPDRPFSGRFVIRVKPATHRALSLKAEAKGVSLNRMVNHYLNLVSRRAKTKSDTPPAAESVKPKTPNKAKEAASGKKKEKEKVAK